MERRFAVSFVLALSFAAGAFVALPRARVASAEECPYCHKEIEEGRGTYNCQECEKTANEIARSAPQWTLEFKNEKPRRVTVKYDERAPENFWWFPYTLKNNDKDAHSFAISITAESDKGKNLYHYVDNAVPEVVVAIRQALGLKDGAALWTSVELGTMPPGQPHTVPNTAPPPGGNSGVISLPSIKPGETFQCAAMFKAFDPEMDFLTIYVRGLSSDVEVETTDQPFRRKVRDRVLELRYESPGDEFMTNIRPITFVSQKWTEVEKIVKTDLR